MAGLSPGNRNRGNVVVVTLILSLPCVRADVLCGVSQYYESGIVPPVRSDSAACSPSGEVVIPSDLTNKFDNESTLLVKQTRSYVETRKDAVKRLLVCFLGKVNSAETGRQTAPQTHNTHRRSIVFRSSTQEREFLTNTPASIREMLVNTEDTRFRNYSRKQDANGKYSGLYRDWRGSSQVL